MFARRRRLAAILAVTAAALSACGGGGGPANPAAAKVRQTVVAALADLAHGDGHAFCTRLTPAGRARLGHILHGYSCARLASLISAHLSPQTRTALLHARVGRVTVRGASATVRAGDITASQGSLTGFLNDHGRPTTLVRGRDGSWRIDR